MPRLKIPLQPEQLEELERLAGIGLSNEKIALYFRMSKKTLERRLKDTEGAKDAMGRGRAISEVKVSQTAYDMAISGKDGYMTQYWLNCRAGWKPTSIHEHTGKDGAPISFMDWAADVDKDIRGEKKPEK